MQGQIADEFGLFKAVVKILDRTANRYAEWPTARLTVWLDLMRENFDVTADSAFDAVDIQWMAMEEENVLNESLNSSRISLNLSAMKDAILGKPMKSRFEALRQKFSPWSEKKQRTSNSNTEYQQTPKKPLGTITKGIFKEHIVLDDSIDDDKVDAAVKSTSTPVLPGTFDQQAQQYLRDLRKTALAMKKLYHDKCKNENCTANEQNVAEQVVNMLEKVEHMTNDIRHLVKNTHSKTTPKKTVRFAFDEEH